MDVGVDRPEHGEQPGGVKGLPRMVACLGDVRHPSTGDIHVRLKAAGAGDQGAPFDAELELTHRPVARDGIRGRQIRDATQTPRCSCLTSSAASRS